MRHLWRMVAHICDGNATVASHSQLRRQVGLGARLDLHLGRLDRLAGLALLVKVYRVLL
jgi:hypothetical protein